ncbi:MAG: L-histidine N(alpha)-methyltransferase [Candidatus Latescibacterota bacterium]|nr:L-histidine N(alpha)-methyltransferase [Candidatus Latescibacterota bacterium]
MSTDDGPECLTLVGSTEQSTRTDIAGDVRVGLTSMPKWLPCIYFYDDAGSELFEQICELPEYYPTRTERSILETHADALVAHVQHRVDLVELGSGSATKTRLVVEALLRRHGELRFIPVDISRSILEESSRSLVEDYDRLEVHAVAGEYHDGLDYLKHQGGPPRLILWLGSNVGNFQRPDATHFLQRLHSTMRAEDRLLIGIDLRKEATVLEAAYDDAAGVTAAFNKNLLTRLNADLSADFDLDRFVHQSRWNAAEGRVEMHLVSQCRQSVCIKGIDLTVEFEDGESIHTENAYKYSAEEIESLATSAHFEAECQWLDEAQRFSVNLWKPRS